VERGDDSTIREGLDWKSL